MSKLGNKLLTRANGNLPLDESDKKAVIEKAAAAYAQFLDALQFDWKSDTNSADTPRRVAKAFVNDLISGCYNEPPNITVYCLMDIPPLLDGAAKALLPIFSEIDAQVKENLAKILLGKYGEAIDFPK